MKSQGRDVKWQERQSYIKGDSLSSEMWGMHQRWTLTAKMQAKTSSMWVIAPEHVSDRKCREWPNTQDRPTTRASTYDSARELPLAGTSLLKELHTSWHYLPTQHTQEGTSVSSNWRDFLKMQSGSSFHSNAGQFGIAFLSGAPLLSMNTSTVWVKNQDCYLKHQDFYPKHQDCYLKHQHVA